MTTVPSAPEGGGGKNDNGGANPLAEAMSMLDNAGGAGGSRNVEGFAINSKDNHPNDLGVNLGTMDDLVAGIGLGGDVANSDGGG